MGHRQIVQAKIRRHRLQRRIRFSTICLQDVLLKFELEWKTTPNNPEDENGLVNLIKVGNFIRLKRVNEMVTFILRFVWFCNVIEHWNRLFFPRFFILIHFRGQGLSLRTTLCHCKNYIVAVANERTQINYWKFCFALFLSMRLSLNVEIVHIKS